METAYAPTTRCLTDAASCLTLLPFSRNLALASILPMLGKRTQPNTGHDLSTATAIHRRAIEGGLMRRTVSFDVVREVPTAAQVQAVQQSSDRPRRDLPALPAAR